MPQRIALSTSAPCAHCSPRCSTLADKAPCRSSYVVTSRLRPAPTMTLAAYSVVTIPCRCSTRASRPLAGRPTSAVPTAASVTDAHNACPLPAFDIVDPKVRLTVSPHRSAYLTRTHFSRRETSGLSLVCYYGRPRKF